jgi:CRISPR/Cas system-associated protein Csm6
MSDNLKLLKTFNSRIEAELIKSFLQANGIKSLIVSDDAGEMYPSASLYWGVKLFVRDLDYEAAYKLVNPKDLNL